ncbi:conserved hypothetical protein [Catenulispora acidiphila DSM 44928]|uniref:Oxidoreductase molybdopterin-binding domain-containing protein n=1 Tax=Catenulispora acidiphila (strain DSM 44928 / JCM 14897 / NBRC 102108 / NRRL B-24433 / ID139908) TaxID=479433 RepID=C7Q0D7_CATAD|nr:hypothetical protein [Catenulispora acidiphila]ACU77470.1 conserved hypothetical protein [Catenulispora acidiphila DSM 44928]
MLGEQTGTLQPAEGALIRLGGDVHSPRELSASDLWSLSRHECEVEFSCRKRGPRRHRFTGPLLLDVAHLAEPAFVPGERKDRLRYLISIRARDGHRVVLSWAEIDPEFANIPVLLGLTRDGDALDAEGPQLVVPGDVCGARHVSGVADVRIRSDSGD